MRKRSKLAEILSEAQGNTHAERLIRRAYRAGRKSVDRGELLAVGWVYPEYLDEMHRGYVFGVPVGNEKVASDQIKVEVRRAS